MEKAKFYKSIQIIFEDRNLTEPSELWLSNLYSKVTSLSDEQIIAGFKEIMNITALDWNEQYGFRGKPAMIDWLTYFQGSKPMTIEDLARQEVEEVLYQVEKGFGYSEWKPEHPTTAKIVNSYSGGLSTIHFDLFDSWNENKKNESFYKKEMIEKWITFEKTRLDAPKTIEVNENVNKLLPNFKQ